MALLHSKTSNTSDSSHALAFGSSQGNPASHALKHASIKIAGVVFFLAICLLLLAAGGVSGTQQNNTSANTSGNDLGAGTDFSAGDSPSTTSTSVSASQSSDGVSKPSVKVTVNGQNVPVPENGNVQKTITDASGTTSLNVSTSTQGGSSNYSSTSTSLNVSSNSSSFGSTYSNNYTYGAP